MISIDEFGPVEVRPQKGWTWAEKGHPARIRARYRRIHGVRNYLSAYDVHGDRLIMRCFKRKRWQEILRFLKYVRSQYRESLRLYIIWDNWSPHKKEEVVRWARRANVSLVYTPTNASWINPIESIFSGLHYFVFSSSDFDDHGQINLAIRKYVRWRNSHPYNLKLDKLEKRKLISDTRY